ncbi:MAG TPA: ribosome-associated translation inhibitor RaiA [Polyangiaceae bacterium]|jgi:putative sigma-54 modulation protein
MNVSITFRHVDPSDALKRYATTKIAKLQKFLRQPMTAKVTLSVDRLKQVAEVRISSGGEHLEAKEGSDDLYASIDIVVGKLERQVRASKGAQQAKRRGSDSVRSPRVAAARATSDEASAARPKKRAPAKRAKKAR